MLTIHETRLPLLEAGALFRLYVGDELKRVLPCEDEMALDAAAPRFEDGKPVFDPKAVEAREDAIVANVLRGGPVAVLVLGVSHDLRDNVRRLAPDAELITVRVETVPAELAK